MAKTTENRRFQALQIGSGIVFALLVVGACAGTPPTAEFRTYSQAAEEVSRTTLRLLDDFEAAAPERRTPNASEAYPLVFRPAGFDRRSNGDVRTRRNAVEAIRTYNTTMLFLAEGGSYEAVKGQVESLAGTISGVFPGAGVAGGWLGTLAAELEKARSAQEFRDALRAATVPGQDCEAKETSRADPTETLVSAAIAAACLPVIDGIYEILKQDAGSFYARQVGLVSRRTNRLRDQFGAAYTQMIDFGQNFRRPANGTDLTRLIQIEASIRTIAVAVNPLADAILVPLGSNTGRPFDGAALATLEQQVALLEPLAESRRRLVDALNGYYAALGDYVVLIARAQAHLKAVETAAARPTDNLARLGEIARIGVELQNDAIGSRRAFERLSVVLLGTRRS